MRQYRALDLFCGEGGASAGLASAGFTVIGVDLFDQPNYPYEFIRADALTFPLDGAFDFIWASPVCKRFSSATRTSRSQHRHPDQIEPIRLRLKEWGGPYVIENVYGAPLSGAVMLCGASFDLKVYRHRFFETNWPLRVPEHASHTHRTVRMGRPPGPDDFINPVGHFSGVSFAQKAMGINWMGQTGLAQAIPPAYSKFIGEAWLAQNNT